MTVTRTRHEVIFHWWNGSSHDKHNALVRSVDGGDDDSHPPIDLTWMHPTNFGTNVNAVDNVEAFADATAREENDYWRGRMSRQGTENSLPFVSFRPEQGDIVWFIRYDATENEEEYFKALVKEVVGPAPHPRLDLTYVNKAGSRVNANGVIAVNNVTFPTSDDYWGKRILRQGDEE